MFEILTKLCAVFLMVGFGVLARGTGIIDDGTTKRLARLLTRFFYPALIYSSFVTSFTARTLAGSWVLPVGTFLLMLLGHVVGRLASPLLRPEAEPVRRGFLFQCTINNYVFLPMPLVLLYLGGSGVANLVLSTLGSELAVWTLGVLALTGHGLSARTLRNLLSMPLVAIGAAVATILLRDAFGADISPHLLGQPWAGTLTASLLSGLELFGGATVPVAMVIVGSRMFELRPGHLFRRSQVLLAAMRLVVIPGIALLILSLIPLATDVRRVLVIVAVMPSAMASVVLSELYNGDSQFAASGILTTHLLAIATIPIWLSMWL